MHVKKRFLALAIAAVAASFVVVPSAPAAQIAHCTFTGGSGNLSPDIAPAPGEGRRRHV